MRELNQKIFLEERRFKLTETGLETYVNDLDMESENFVPYEDFSNSLKIYTEKFPKIMYIALAIFLLAALRSAIMADPVEIASTSSTWLIAIGAVLVFIYKVYQKEYKALELDDGRRVFILANSPSTQEVNAFIEDFFEMRKKDYRKRYFTINTDNEQQKEIDRMYWLHRENIITESELDFILDEIKIKFL